MRSIRSQVVVRRVRRRVVLAIVGTAVGLAVVTVTGCSKPPAESAAPAAAPETPAVTVVKPQRRTVRYTIRQPVYNIEAFQQTPVYAKISGYVGKVNFDIGDNVRRDEVLVELSVPEMHVELRQKEALVKQAESQVRQAREAATAADASLRSMEAKVKETEAGRLRSQAEIKRTRGQYERLNRVGRSGVLDQEAIDETQYGFEAATAGLAEIEARVKSAEATRDEAKAKLEKARADVSVAEEQVSVARENRDYVKTLLGYTQVRSPFDGTVTRRFADVGHFVQPAASGGSKGEPLFVVEQTDLMRVFVNVPELEGYLVHKETPAVIYVQGLLGEEFKGTVTRTSASRDPRARTLRTEIDLPNPGKKLQSGMYGSAGILIEHKDVWTLPPSAVVTQGEESFCYEVQNGKAARVPIRVGLRGSELMEVVKKKVKPTKAAGESQWEDLTGDEAVAANAAAITADGQTVKSAGSAK